MEFLVHMKVDQIVDSNGAEKMLREQEAARSRELSDKGILLRLWRVPGRRENWGIWKANDCDELHNALVSLPLFQYLTITVHPLASHPNDPMGLSKVSATH
ncbi:MAG: muconolactone delta-isomerase [Edaphobacter sp.]|jgi:muconolactone D-isomerase|nr:muconolactone delta-isomerase [Edaphobacter sp.]